MHFNGAHWEKSISISRTCVHACTNMKNIEFHHYWHCFSSPLHLHTLISDKKKSFGLEYDHLPAFCTWFFPFENSELSITSFARHYYFFWFPSTLTPSPPFFLYSLSFRIRRTNQKCSYCQNNLKKIKITTLLWCTHNENKKKIIIIFSSYNFVRFV